MPVQQIGNDGLVDSRRIASRRCPRHSLLRYDAWGSLGVRDFEEHVSVTLIH